MMSARILSGLNIVHVNFFGGNWRLAADRILNMKLDLSSGNWLNKPANYLITETSVAIETDPGTDFWQRSYYGFRVAVAIAILEVKKLVIKTSS